MAWHRCEQCGKKFAFQKSLLEHQSQAHHTKIRSEVLRCKQCPYEAVGSTADLELHERLQHANGNSQRNKCNKCRKSFDSLPALLRHKEILHPSEEEYALQLKPRASNFPKSKSVDAKWTTAYDDSLSSPRVPPIETQIARSEKNKKLKISTKYKKNTKQSPPKKRKYETKYDGEISRQHRARRDISDNQVDGDFARVLDRVIKLTAPKARSRLQTMWKRLRSMLFNTKDGANGERADELTKALFQQLFKQFDLPTVLRKRADKLRRRVGPSGAGQSSNSTADSLKKDDSVRVVDFRKKGEESKSGDNQIQQWLGMVTDGDKSIAKKEKIDVESGTSTTTTTAAPTSTTRFPQLSLFQRRKGPVRVSVKVPQKHAKSGIRRFAPAQVGAFRSKP
ncbi:uncharacterized protein LOC114828089 [Galendromus occidentalis]|uniref:Uncharacterized protein LOC114828089 n=1 Tax=Galendromus occidentalis TaxID=34638 RepID=A0AAJ7SF74_9ACAR|nr:uncharacterized protein LOC114828089 [Galendromus occidentalis]